VKAPSSRELICVDLRGMKAAVVEHARARGVTPSDFVRATLTVAMGQPGCSIASRPVEPSLPIVEERVRLSLRMSRSDAVATVAAARAAGLALGAYVAGLVAGIPALTTGHSRDDYLVALIASNAEMATFGRKLGQLVSLLRQGSTRAAQEYREMLDGIARKVHEHLALVSAVVAELRPRREGRPPTGQPGSHLSRR
jgi:hypothetical protein